MQLDSAVVYLAPQACHYCGEVVHGRSLCRDHLRPKSKGGRNSTRNIVPACNVCNSIKGAREIDAVRYRLVQKKIGWPRFNLDQLAWLRANGFDMREFDNARLAFECEPTPSCRTS
jgi:5-methylcytosine-specific restriction endonuclease McrA